MSNKHAFMCDERKTRKKPKEFFLSLSHEILRTSHKQTSLK